MSSFPHDWALCGGWAVDAWLGRQTREHHDVDIAIFVEDQGALPELLAGWQVVAHDDHWSGENPIFAGVPIVAGEIWDGKEVEIPGHFHVRAADGFEFELNLNARTVGEWVFNEAPRITLALERCLYRPGWGVPAVSPEVLVFYKALPPLWRDQPRTALRPHDEADFAALLPMLNAAQRGWLKDAITVVDAGHPWLGRLAM
jgi:hypothetical protein